MWTQVIVAHARRGVIAARLCGGLLTWGCLLALGNNSFLAAQFIVTVNSPSNSSNNAAAGAGVDEAVQNALTDFERFAERNDWQKAFRVLENLPIEKRVGMLPAGNGFMIPAKSRFWHMLTGMNAEGRATFKLFYEPKAKQLWEQLQEQIKTDQATASQTARSIYDQYFMTSYGDDAANLLGDLAFERGDFTEAALQWRSIIDFHGDSNIPLSRLVSKCATAYAAMGRLADASVLLSQQKSSQPDAKAVIGGQEVVVVKYLESLIEKQSSGTASSANEPALQLTSPMLKPDWEVTFLSPKGRKIISDAVAANSYYQSGIETLVPSYDTDGERVYLNWMGVIFAVDQTSGKLVWRTDSFSNVHNHLAELHQGRVDLMQYSVQVIGDRVLTTALPLDRLNYWQPPIPLTAWNAKTGAKIWSVGGEQNGGVSYLGRFYPWEGGILVISHPQQQAEMSLNRLSLETGKAEWSIPLGTVQGKNNPYSGGMSYGSPEFVRLGSQLNLMNNSGALLQINPDMKTIEGQYRLYEQETTTDESQYYYYNGMIGLDKRLHTRGRLVEKDGLVLMKEIGQSELHCLDLASQKVLWKRPTSSSAMILEVDEELVYVMDSELSAHERMTGKLRWSINLPVNGGGLSLISSTESVFVSTQRGIYELDRANGRVRQIVRLAGSDSQGIAMRLAGDHLVTVSNYQVVGYRLRGQSGQSATQTPLSESPMPDPSKPIPSPPAQATPP